MDAKQQLALMDKIIRELDDLKNSQTSVLKKITQIEADNINLGNSLLENQLPEIHSKADETLNTATQLVEEFTAVKDKFIKDNKLDELPPEV